MSVPARSVVYQSFRQALARWPADPLRPECQLQDVIGKRLDKEIAAVSSGTAVGAKLSEGTQLKQVNALYSLLENRYQTKYGKEAGRLMKPRSNPTHYTDLIKELEEAPNRSWFGRMTKRLGGLIRFS